MKARHLARHYVFLAVWTGIAVVSYSVDRLALHSARLASGLTVLQMAGLLATILAAVEICTLATHIVLARQNKPPVEGMMIGRLYGLGGALVVGVGVAYGLGQLAAFGAFFSLFGGMLLGWSLQAPVSGMAAWVLLSLKRPFRPGDRIQFPLLGLTGDVHDIGIMYTTLNQVGGSIGSEEAVGRYILVPNAMLFSQVVINYTVTQEAAYMLDEVVVRITYDSNWEVAERILVKAATDLTSDIIETTGVQPYIRSDLYDYGVYMRLRYQTRVKDRAETASKISQRIFEDFQREPSVDLAIPYVYSYRTATDKKNPEFYKGRGSQQAQDIEIDRIHSVLRHDPEDIEELAESIVRHGLLQPIVVVRNPEGDYGVVAGHLRLEACRRLGWRTIRAIVQNA